MATPTAPTAHLAALNANTSVQVLGELAARHPREVLRNPALALHRLANPAFLGAWPLEGLLALVREPDVPAWLLDAAGRHPDVRAPGRGVAGLTGSPNPFVRAAVAGRAALPAEALGALAADDVASVRGAVALHPLLPTEWRGALLRDPYAGVRAAVAGRADLTLGQMAVLAADAHPDVAGAAAARADLPGFLLARAATHAAFRVRLTVAAHPFLPPDLHARLSADRSAGVRAAALGERAAHLHGPGAPEAVRVARGGPRDASLLTHPLAVVRRVAARAWPLRPPELAALTRDADAGVRALLAERADLPRHAARALAHDADVLVAHARATCGART
ncbi:hypothetical protein [Deinococcus maricopensis]|uniref:Leucine rich repeat variant-containing protein n=1 Tax=Deinococcus maricopensis (strain DSM 21211 / LMG 22137 / NRRL B-23946 / LB-34) TaxID=709986 RepID=E8U907_DEIML|nr:hypothetical protein [Deinococcus maricopensis]ADV67546.1 hypothetical protein Deima_1901 [Deinococcus maricopensis DSM 21211]